MIDAQIAFLSLLFFLCAFSDRVCQQPGLSLWVPFQNAATAVTNLYKGKDHLAAALPAEGTGSLRQGFSPACQVLSRPPSPGPRLPCCVLLSAATNAELLRSLGAPVGFYS